MVRPWTHVHVCLQFAGLQCIHAMQVQRADIYMSSHRMTAASKLAALTRFKFAMLHVWPRNSAERTDSGVTLRPLTTAGISSTSCGAEWDKADGSFTGWSASISELDRFYFFLIFMLIVWIIACACICCSACCEKCHSMYAARGRTLQPTASYARHRNPPPNVGQPTDPGFNNPAHQRSISGDDLHRAKQQSYTDPASHPRHSPRYNAGGRGAPQHAYVDGGAMQPPPVARPAYPGQRSPARAGAQYAQYASAGQQSPYAEAAHARSPSAASRVTHSTHSRHGSRASQGGVEMQGR